MTDFDAAAALLMLSSGSRSSTVKQTIVSENNNLDEIALSPGKKRPRKSVSPKQRISVKSSLRMIDVQENYQQHNREVLQLASPSQSVPRMSVSPTPIAENHRAQQDSMAGSSLYGRLGSSSPELEPWSRTSSPIIVQREQLALSALSGRAKKPASDFRTMLYASPGMNGFAMLLNSGVAQQQHYTSSSPELQPDEDHREKRLRVVTGPAAVEAPIGGTGRNIPEDKSARSPSDSGVSSIHDELLQPNLVLQRWRLDVADPVPESVKAELISIMEISAFNKELYTKTQMAKFPLDMGFNPNKSRIRKECQNAIDNDDRIKNNAASRRSRHKKKLMTQIMNIGLEFDRQENRQLFMQERWFSDRIYELEEKALAQGIDAQVLRQLRTACGFQ
uniref:BZIP domain-containing protein n=1 Tax=Anopheles dirus TaxID=7168 RepID=A0A182NTF1_9DIPT